MKYLVILITLFTNLSSSIDLTRQTPIEKTVYLKDSQIDVTNSTFIYKNNLSFIPKKEEKIFVSNTCNYSQGGLIERVDISTVHKDNIEMFKKILKISNNNYGLRYLGIDYMTKDISKSYKDGNGFINEINCGPGIDIHYFADLKTTDLYDINLVKKKVKKGFNKLKNLLKYLLDNNPNTI